MQYQTKLSAGLDLCSLYHVTLPPFGKEVVDTGVYLKDVMSPDLRFGSLTETDVVPFAMVCSRSGLAANDGIIVLNAPGIVDADYEGTIKVILYNTNPLVHITICGGTRIAQLVFTFAYRKTALVKDEDRQGGLGSTDRGAGT
jgi:dUTP pyrophosphatase